MKTYTDVEINAALARIEGMLRDLGVPADTGACKCGRCERRADHHAPAVPVQAPAPSGGPGGALVTKSAPVPRAPRPGGIAVAVPEIVF